MTSAMIDHVIATDRALALLVSLRETYGPLVLFQPSCGNNDIPTLCLALDDFGVGSADDVYLGSIDGVPFYIGYDQFEHWKNTQLVIDAVDGTGAMHSLDVATGKHFVTRSREDNSLQ